VIHLTRYIPQQELFHLSNRVFFKLRRDIANYIIPDSEIFLLQSKVIPILIRPKLAFMAQDFHCYKTRLKYQITSATVPHATLSGILTESALFCRSPIAISLLNPNTKPFDVVSHILVFL